jgi:uncharacterized protein YndB with AHSA1/START domain
MSKLKWLLAAAALFVTIFLAMTFIGRALPSRHVATSSITVNQPVDSVWSAIRDFAGYPTWWPHVVTLNRTPDTPGREVWSQRDKYGDELPLEVVEEEPPRRLVTRIGADDLPFGGTWTYELSASVEGCTVTLTEDGEIDNPLFRFMARFVFGHHGTLESYLKALGRRFGEEPGVVRFRPAS